MNSDGPASRACLLLYVVYARSLDLPDRGRVLELPVLLDASVTSARFPFPCERRDGGFSRGVRRSGRRYLVAVRSTYVIIGIANACPRASSVRVLRENWQLYAFYIVFGSDLWFWSRPTTTSWREV